MFQGINIFGFYNNRENRTYTTLPDDNFIVSFSTFICPPIFFICTKTQNAISFKLNDLTNEVLLHQGNLTKLDVDDLSVFYYPGEIFAQEKTICNAEFELTESVTNNKYYSDVFLITNDFSDKIKIKTISEDITFMSSYRIPIKDIPFEFYLNCNNSKVYQNIVETKTNEVGVEKPNGDIPSFCTIVYDNKLDILGNTNIFKFLSLLRIFCINGNVEITKNNETVNIYNIIVSQKEDSGYQEGFVIQLSYSENNYISSRNAI